MQETYLFFCFLKEQTYEINLTKIYFYNSLYLIFMLAKQRKKIERKGTKEKGTKQCEKHLYSLFKIKNLNIFII